MGINSKRKKSLFTFETGPLNLSASGSLKYLFLFNLILILSSISAYPQNVYQPTNTFGSIQPYTNYIANSSAFKQEIARLEINVVRAGKNPLPVTQVPRLVKGDLLKVRLSDEIVNGAKPDQSNFDWTFVVAYINPGRNLDRERSVSEEINFRKTGWYKEYTFVVPFDSQPIFFLYPKPEYRGKILNLISKNQDEIMKIGEKTLEISGAYGKISSFLNELQAVINMNSSYMYGYYGGNYNNYNNYYNSYGSSYGSYSAPGFNMELFKSQMVERLAKSFNIQLPGCWQNGYNSYNNYGAYNNNGAYNNGYNYGNYYNSGLNSDFLSKIQCVAKNVRIEDLDISISRMLQQGGIMAATQLAQKYPQIAFWINIAAAALDFILQVTRKTPLKLVPTVISANSSYQEQAGNYQTYNYNQPAGNAFNPPNVSADSGKISLYAESQPNNNNVVTAYPIVVQKWQSNPDPEIIGLPVPVLADNCLHVGQNLLKSTDLINDWMSDKFTKDFKLVISSSNGFYKEFALKKNIGLGGWDLNVTAEDLNAFPKIKMDLESEVVGKRGFNEIRSPKFELSVPVSSSWNIAPESQKAFAVGGRKTVTIKNQLGNCKCLQSVVYKPSFGGQFVYEGQNLNYSEVGENVSFEIDTTNFQAGQGQLELRTYGGETINLELNLYPAPPEIGNVKMSRGDKEALLIGQRLEQIKAVKINGRLAAVVDENSGVSKNAPVNAVNRSVQGAAKSPDSSTGAVNAANSFIQNEIKVAFADKLARQDSNLISLELILEDNRIVQYAKKFSVSLARPSILANQNSEIDGFAIGNQVEEKQEMASAGNNKANVIKTRPGLKPDLTSNVLFPIESSEITVNVQNALTDYEFKYENIEIETRIEKSQVGSSGLPQVNLEVLDWKNLKISFLLNEQSQKLLGGRRLQFRIKDKSRGNSDWYTVRQTFVRAPSAISVNCPGQIGPNCEMKGEGLEYISQISVDNGFSWYPKQPATLTVLPTANGLGRALIPYVRNRQSLKIRLRDLPTFDGTLIYSNR